MGSFAQNLRLLRKSRGITQAQLAGVLNLNRPVVGAYEEGRAEPKIEILRAMASYFRVSLDELVSDSESLPVAPAMRVLPIIIDENSNTERIPLVPVKAAAGYLNGFGDPEFIQQLDVFHLPFSEMNRERTHRLFQIEGDSMLPVPDGSYIITDFVMDWETLREGACYIIVSISQGIVFKRISKSLQASSLRLISDNEVYSPFEIAFNDIHEIWRARGYVSFEI